MIFEEMIYVFRNDLMLEYTKRGIPEANQVQLNKKQIKLIFSKIVSDLQKECKILLSEQTITANTGEASYALMRSFMDFVAAFYNDTKLTLKDLSWMEKQTPQSGTPVYCALKWVAAYPYIILYPKPAETGKSIVVKSYNDIGLYSYNDGIDSSIAGAETEYLKIPTQYDQAILLGMISQIFEDRIPLYQKEKMRLKALRFSAVKLDYNMTGIPKAQGGKYNSDADVTPTTLPSEPSY